MSEDIQTTSMLESALDAARRGLRVYPLHWPMESGGAVTCSCSNGSSCKAIGKHPLVSGWKNGATTDEDQIGRWWSKTPNANYCITTGDGLLVLDIDPRNEGDRALAELQSKYGDLPVTLTTMTGGGGLHFYFRVECGGSWKKQIGRGLDVKADGGYVVGAGSLHASGIRYAWRGDAAITDAPQWLVELAKKRAVRRVVDSDPGAAGSPYAAAAIQDEVRRVRVAAPGTRNNQLNESAFKLGTLVGNGSADRASVIQHLLGAALDAGLGQDEAEQTIKSGLDAGVAQPRTPRFRNTDVGHGEHFAHLNRDRAIYVKAWRAWFVWDGTRWRRDELGVIHRWAKEVPRALLRDASAIEDDDKRKYLTKAASALENASRLEAMLRMAQSELAGEPADFDRDLDLLTVSNGTIDLRTGELRGHSQADRITKFSRVHYDPNAPCERWLRFLDEVLCEDSELAAFLQRAIGYTLTGHTREHVFFLLHGSGKNGKGRLIRQLMALVGDAAHTTGFATFTADRARQTGNTPELAAMAGARMVVAGEPDEGVRLSESVIKSLTGEDEISACAKYQEPFRYTPQFKIWLHTNHKPEIRGTDTGIWRRPRFIPFNATFDGDRADPFLDEKLDAERSGILAWAVAGARLWYRDGLGAAAAVTAATSDYRRESDALAPFMEEYVGTMAGFTSNKDLYAAYRRWCVDNGSDPWRCETLSKRLVQRGLRSCKERGVRGFAVTLTDAGQAAARRPVWAVHP